MAIDKNEKEFYDKNDDSRLDEMYGVPDKDPNLGFMLTLIVLALCLVFGVASRFM